ncbi:hypothetical protein HDF26_002213 [Pedobacter cryoconitis]|uniref:Outer membrane protein beta-barrel domain-containing protein n=1 Tax=Pedobacter cryoconitis TaxID=188932 RepID=A0A7W8ZJK4_9SPHI|nr:outer membrane beta-barrel family protein [Pedobacter cryoconitis]MBB5635060.1 hypothetical protein [Pedobacter cryoconitis]MBB6271756.1 hypothetical protein [Pedobacter cryoconitis]
MKKKLSLILCLLSLTILSKAQIVKISGKIKSEPNTALNMATITLRTVQDSILVKGTASDEQGVFVLESLNAGKYILHISHLGYEPFHQRIDLADRNIILKDIILAKDLSVKLDAVEVRSKRPLIARSLDKLTLNIEGSVYEKGEDALRLFNIIPGVQATSRDITFRGSEKVTVYVNNRRILLSADQILAYLRTIPSESIKSYELRQVPGAEYDAQNGGVIINIVLKSDYRYGLSGSVNSGYWYNRENNTFSSASANYGVEKLTIQGGFTYRNSPAFYEDNIRQEFKQTNIYNTQTEKYIEKYPSIAFNAGFDYRLTPNQILGANYNRFDNPGDFSNTTTTSSDFFSNKNSNQKDSSSYSTKNTRFTYRNQIANAFYRNKLDTLGSKLDIGYSYVNYDLNDPSALETKFFNSAGAEIGPRDSLFAHNKGKSNVHVFNMDWEQHYGKSLQLNLGGKYTTSKTDYAMEYRNGLDGNAPLDILRSNRFIYQEKILALYSTLTKSFKNWEVKAGLRAEQTDYNGQSVTTNETIGRNRWDFFPSTYVRRKLGEQHALSFSYARRIDRPGFRQLNPFTFYTSLNTIQQGNPNLLPYFSNNLQLEYVFKNKYTLTVGYQNTKAGIATNVTNIGDVIVSKDANISDNRNSFLSVYIPVQITDWWEFNMNATLRNTILDVRTTPEVHRSKFSQDFWAVQKFTLPGKYYVEVSGNYGRNRFYDIYDSFNTGNLNIYVKKSFFKDRLTTRLELADPFHLNKPGNTIDSPYFTRISERTRLDYIRSVGIFLNYSFSGGKKTTNREGVDAGGNEARGRL